MEDKTIDLVFKLWFETNKEHERVMEENKFGLLNKEFVKKHLQRETELENRIEELENKLKNINKNTDIVNNFYYSDDMCKSLLAKIALRMTVLNVCDPSIYIGSNDITSSYYNNFKTISIDNVDISTDEYNFLYSLAKEEVNRSMIGCNRLTDEKTTVFYDSDGNKIYERWII